MTETPILDESAVEEIEARAASASPKYVVNWSKGEHALLQASGWRPINEEQPRTIATFDKDEGYLDLLFCAEARTDIPALCATVKHLRAERNALRDSASIVAFQAHQIDGKIAESLIEQGARLQREADAKLVEGYHECPSTNDYNIAAAIRAGALEKL